MMRRSAITVLLATAMALAASDVPAPHSPARKGNAMVPVSASMEQARKALFEDSQLDRARQLAQEQLQQDGGDVEALFMEMEAAALQADSAAELNAALKMCESHGPGQRDDRVGIAAARVLELAANTEDFRAAIPRIQAMLASGQRRKPAHSQTSYLRAALLAAAADGAPGIELDKVVRDSGLMTEWRVAGPFGHYGRLEFDQHWSPERDALAASSSDGHPVERLHFDDGAFRLPQYFPRQGVLYAAADSVAGGNLMVRVESAGTLELLVDGAVVLRKDDRFHQTPTFAWRALHLRNGTHRVVVKFLASAAPFRIALLEEAPGNPPQNRAFEINYAPEADYVVAAQKYWAGDYGGVIADLYATRTHRSALTDLLLYRAWTHVAEESPEAPAMLNAVLQAAPSAMAAEYELASRALAADRTDEALMRLQRVVSARENFVAGQQLLAQIALRLNWPVLTEKALELQLRVHPSCDVLLQGYKFFAGHARYERARDLRRRLADCAPDTQAYERSLGEAGEHASAAFAAEATVRRHPLDRSARELLVRELALAGQTERARAAAAELAALAPNSSRYRRMAENAAANADALIDEGGLRNIEFARPDPFYAKYRRDGVEMVRKSNDRKFSGGPAVMLMNDRVARLWEGGEVSIYVHKLTRVLDRDGIEKYGEAEIPRAAEVLELRTIKADGSVVEPEATPQKATASMPALAAGDAIEEEYVLHYGDSGGMAEHAGEFRHAFGSFAAPILYSRFVVITPAADNSVRADVAPGIVPARVETIGNSRVRTWEKNDIPQSVEEVATARGDVLPGVVVEQEFRGGWNNVRDHFRNQLVDAVRIGPRVERAAAQVRAQEPQAKAREIFRTVVNSVRSAGSFNPEDMTSAEETLASRSGARTIAVLAVARAAGLDADLVLARNAGTLLREGRASLRLYSRPLLRFRLADGRELFADAEAEGLAFGALPPSLDRHDALLVPVLRENVETAAGGPLLSLPGSTEEQSVADADVTLDGDGSLQAQVTIRMGAWRGAQMRTILAGIEPGQRARFYQQLAQRIFAGADEVTGETRNEHDPDRPLELALHCRAPRYVSLGQSTTEIDQLVPTLGLKKMYSGAMRRFPLFIDTPLVESARFRVRLPAGVSLAGAAPELNLSGAFGSYSLSLRQLSPDVLDIQRSFRIPAQVVAPERFADFSLFAAKIDEAERQKIILQRN